MKGRVIVLDMPEDRGFAAALVENGTLEDLILDPPLRTHPARPGDVWMTRITRKLPGTGGAGMERARLPGGGAPRRGARGLSPAL